MDAADLDGDIGLSVPSSANATTSLSEDYAPLHVLCDKCQQPAEICKSFGPFIFDRSEIKQPEELFCGTCERLVITSRDCHFCNLILTVVDAEQLKHASSKIYL
jgi:hypothetical protein